jgi:hypothetical protein
LASGHGIPYGWVMTYEPGTKVFIQTADGQLLPRRAISDVERGEDFPVVWVSREEEWEAAQAEGREPDAVPWPAEDVQLAEDENEAAFRVVRQATEDK